MAIEQEPRREAYELPLQELRNLAPDMLWRDMNCFPPSSPRLFLHIEARLVHDKKKVIKRAGREKLREIG